FPAQRIPREGGRPRDARTLLGGRSRLRQRRGSRAEQGRDPAIDARTGIAGARQETGRAEDDLFGRSGEGPRARPRRRGAELPAGAACGRQDQSLPQRRDVGEAEGEVAGRELAGNARDGMKREGGGRESSTNGAWVWLLRSVRGPQSDHTSKEGAP